MFLLNRKKKQRKISEISSRFNERKSRYIAKSDFPAWNLKYHQEQTMHSIKRKWRLYKRTYAYTESYHQAEDIRVEGKHQLPVHVQQIWYRAKHVNFHSFHNGELRRRINARGDYECVLRA